MKICKLLKQGLLLLNLQKQGSTQYNKEITDWLLELSFQFNLYL